MTRDRWLTDLTQPRKTDTRLFTSQKLVLTMKSSLISGNRDIILNPLLFSPFSIFFKKDNEESTPWILTLHWFEIPMFPWEVDHLECNKFLKFEKKDVAFNYNTMVIYTCILPISIHIWCGKQRSTNASCTGISLISGASSEYLYLCIPRLNERKRKEKDVSIINTTNVVAADYAQENAYQENTGINDPQNKKQI